MRNRILLLVALSALLAAAYVALNRTGSYSAPSVSRSSLGEEATTAERSVSETNSRHAAPPPVSPDQPSDKVRRYQELRARLNKARDARLASDATPEPKAGDQEAEPGDDAPPVPPRPLGSLDKEYIQKQIKEIVPLIRECYEVALDTAPDLQGRVVVEIKLIGEEDIGGLIESSLVLEEESDVTDPNFLECVRETMYAVELEAPEGGGSVVIKYPLSFAPAPSGEDNGDGT